MTGKVNTFVIGHKSPDTDSVCSAIAYAELKSAEGMENVLPARAGDLNPQTAFILDYLKVAPPRYLPDVYPKARDIMSTDIVHVSENTPLQNVMEIMREEKIRFIPVLDSEKKPKGALTLIDLARRYIEAEGSIEVATPFVNIVKTLKAEVVLDYFGDAELSLSVYVAAMKKDSFLKILGGKDPRGCAIIVGDRRGIQRASAEKGIGLLIISGGFEVEEEVLEEARRKRVSVIVSPFDTATTAILARLSTPACRICNGGFEKAAPDELVSDLKHKIAGANAIMVLNAEGVMQGVITKSNMLRPSGTKLILVDHNELAQSVDGADKVEILEVVDHHRIGNFNSSNPIPFICEPVGSTSTLVAEFYQRKGAPIKKETAGLLLAGVLSDTVILKSPTTTERDKTIVRWLEEKSGLEHVAFGSEIFASTSSLKKRGAASSVNADFKVFEAKGKKFGIGQVETVGFEEFRDEKEKLEAELRKIKDAKELKLSALLVTDIVMATSILLAVGENEVIYNLDYPKLYDNVYELKNVLSRKKQVVPHILSIFNGLY